MLDPEELSADAEIQKSHQKLSLEQVVAIGEELEKLQAIIEVVEAALEEKKTLYKDMAEKQLPEAMLQLGLHSLGLKNGTTINLQDIISASITDENRLAAHDWLRDNGHGDLIKNEVVVSFGKGEDGDAAHLMNAIHTMDLHYGALVQNEKVHPSTLKAFVKERIKSGEPLPTDIFKVYTGQIARIKRQK